MTIHIDKCGTEVRALVHEAAQHRGVVLSENAEDQLIEAFLLGMRDCDVFVYAIRKHVEISQESRPLAESFAMNGRRCLLMVGLFPEVILRRRLRPQHYIDVGRTSYAHAADHSPSDRQGYYHSICNEFVAMTRTLHAMRSLH